MRTGLFLLSGFLIMAGTFVLARLYSENFTGAATWAAVAFVVPWFLLAVFNRWVGVTKAGYSAAEELPIMLLVFGVPSVAAILVRWKVL